jgi:hypothetical protein
MKYLIDYFGTLKKKVVLFFDFEQSGIVFAFLSKTAIHIQYFY